LHHLTVDVVELSVRHIRICIVYQCCSSHVVMIVAAVAML
jgi:hypothetical protein